MNHKQYRDALKRCDLNQTSGAHKLGIDPRTSRRYALGECLIPPAIARLLEYMEREHKSGIDGASLRAGRPIRRR